MDILASRLRELLDYDDNTGIFSWRVRINGRVGPGQVAGTLKKDGRRRIRIDGKDYFAHRLAIFYATGKWPIADVRHRNGKSDDNVQNNLHVCQRGDFNGNRAVTTRNTSGHRCVNYDKAKAKWRARICVDGKWRHVGYFNDPETAGAAYWRAVKTIYGEFAIPKD